MEDNFINIHENSGPELIEIKTEVKNIPKRITTIYELALPKDENICKKEENKQS